MKSPDRISAIIQSLVLASACSLAAAAWIASLTPPASGYELSLIGAYPPSFWFCTVTASITSSSILLVLAFTRRKSRWWLAGLLGILATHMLLVSLPLWRGYAVHNRTDALNHIGYVIDIQSSGTISKLDFYPVLHILQWMIETGFGVSSGQALILINVLFIPFWTLGNYFLCRQLCDRVFPAYFTLAFAAPLILLYYHTLIIPNVLSVYFIPFLLGLHIRPGQKARNVCAEFLLATFIIFFHPATSLFAFVLLLSNEVTRTARSRKWQWAGWLVPSWIGMVSALWYLRSPLVRAYFLQIMDWIKNPSLRLSAINEARNLVQTAGLPLRELSWVLFNGFGVTVLSVLIMFVLLALYWRKSIRSKYFPDRLILLTVWLALAFLFIAGLFLISSSERHPLRILRHTAIFFPVASGILVWELWKDNRITLLTSAAKRHSNLLISVSLGTLLVLTLFSQINLYENPRNGFPNLQVTAAELSGMQWYLDHGNLSLKTATVLPDYTSRFESYYLGAEGKRKVLSTWWMEDVWLPSHFYPPGRVCIAQAVSVSPAYLLVTDNANVAAQRFPTTVRSAAHLYSEADLGRLENDASASKVYDNGAFTIWLTNTDRDSCNDPGFSIHEP